MRTDPLQTLKPLPTGARYDAVAIGFHWSMVVLVVVVGGLGLLHDEWPRSSQAFWINVHALLGLTLWLTLIARLAWRSTHVPPRLPVDAGRLAARFSSPVHYGLYALMFLTPILGIVTFVYHGRMFDFGWFQFDPHVTKDKAIFGPTEEVHGYLAFTLFGLAGLHALAALWHRFYLHDGVLARMLPRR